MLKIKKINSKSKTFKDKVDSTPFTSLLGTVVKAVGYENPIYYVERFT